MPLRRTTLDSRLRGNDGADVALGAESRKATDAMNYRQALNIDDLERLARKRLPAGVYGFIAGGTQDNRTRDNNRAALDRIRFKPRGLVDVSQRTQEVTLFGSLLSPLHGWFCPKFLPQGDLSLFQ